MSGDHNKPLRTPKEEEMPKFPRPREEELEDLKTVFPKTYITVKQIPDNTSELLVEIEDQAPVIFTGDDIIEFQFGEDGSKLYLNWLKPYAPPVEKKDTRRYAYVCPTCNNVSYGMFSMLHQHENKCLFCLDDLY